MVLELRGTLSAPDTRWTFFQDPLILEDALGAKFPVPSEYDFSLVNVIIQKRFEKGPGSKSVQLGNYELVQARSGGRVLSEQTKLRPGTSVIMAILIEPPIDWIGEFACPMPRCTSTESVSVPGGGRLW